MHAILGIRDVRTILPDMVLLMSEDRGGAPVFGVFACISGRGTVDDEKLSRFVLEPVGASGFQAEVRELIENGSPM